MFVDHGSRFMAEDGTPAMWWIRFFGRLAMPLICYLVAEGHHYTSDKKAYTWRLFLFALLSHFPYVWYFGLSANPLFATGVMWTLTLGLIALTAATNERLTFRGKVVCVAVSCLLAVSANWNYVGVLWIVAFGVFRDDFKKKTGAFLLIGLLLYFLPGLLDFGAFETYRLGLIFAIPLYYLYNRQPGKGNKLSKWGFYWFYPAHLLLFLFLEWFIV